MKGNDAFETIGAFVDRERVDPNDLKHALSTEEGRDYLIDLVALREVTAGPPLTYPALRDRTGVSLRPLALAAAIVLSVAGGYFAGVRHTSLAVPAAVEVKIDAQIPARIEPAALIPPAPTPTSVIQLEPGADFKESAGG